MAPPVLYGPDNRPIDRALLTREIAGPALAGVRSPLTGYPGDGLNPRRLAAILREADQGDPLRYLELAETIEERDPHYAGVLGTRKRSVAQLEVTVDAASDEPEHVRHADTVRAWIARDELADELIDVLDAVGKGYSVTEIIWDTSAGQWQPARLEWRDPRWFRFDRPDYARPHLIGEGGGLTDLPGCKFIFTRIRAKSGLPVRSGVARVACWAWLLKAFTQRDWAIFTQTFGQPVRIGKYGAGATQEDRDTLWRAVSNIAGDCAAIIPESMAIDFVAAPNVGAAHALYKERADWLDQQVSKLVLGQTATTDAIAGGHAVGQEHRQVQEDIERADARALAAVLNRDLVRPWIDLEYGPQRQYPRLRIGRPERRDVTGIVGAVEKLVPMGLRVQASDMRDLLGLADPDAGAELLTSPAAPDPFAGLGPPALQAAWRRPGTYTLQASGRPARQAEDSVDRLAAAAEDIAAPGADDLIDAVRAAVDAAVSLEDLRERLTALESAMPVERLAELMRLALMIASLEGRADVTAGR